MAIFNSKLFVYKAGYMFVTTRDARHGYLFQGAQTLHSPSSRARSVADPAEVYGGNHWIIGVDNVRRFLSCRRWIIFGIFFTSWSSWEKMEKKDGKKTFTKSSWSYQHGSWRCVLLMLRPLFHKLITAGKLQDETTFCEELVDSCCTCRIGI